MSKTNSIISRGVEAEKKQETTTQHDEIAKTEGFLYCQQAKSKRRICHCWETELAEHIQQTGPRCGL